MFFLVAPLLVLNGFLHSLLPFGPPPTVKELFYFLFFGGWGNSLAEVFNKHCESPDLFQPKKRT